MGNTPKRALVIAHEPDGPARQVEIRLVQRGFVVDTHIVTHEYDAPNVATPLNGNCWVTSIRVRTSSTT